jgi:cytosine/adenosine deaminase-related metal-dependent hydrolase
MVVFGAGVDSVRHVVVDGKVVVADGQLLTAEEGPLRQEARQAAQALEQRLGWV